LRLQRKKLSNFYFFNEQPELEENDNFTLRYTVFSSAAVIDIRLYSNVRCIILFEKGCNCNEQKMYSIDERVQIPRAIKYGANGVLNPEHYVQIHRFIYKKIYHHEIQDHEQHR
jgi:hypothetical protein